MNLFRTLTAGEIECRVQRIQGNYAHLLIYKDARVDQRVMDETFGPMNWKSDYKIIEGNLYCMVSVWDKDKGEWVSRVNVGTESKTEAEKGQASDALKRACFSWGLGVELYSAPEIVVPLYQGEVNGNRLNPLVKFRVTAIGYAADRSVSYLQICDQNNYVRFTYGAPAQAPAPSRAEASAPVKFTADDGRTIYKYGTAWNEAIRKTAAGEVCDDGTPIPIWLAEHFHISAEHMDDFFEKVNELHKEEAPAPR